MPEFRNYTNRVKEGIKEWKKHEELPFSKYFKQRWKEIKAEKAQAIAQNLWYDDPIVRKKLLQTMQIDVSTHEKTENPENGEWKEFIIEWIKCKKIEIKIPGREWYDWETLTFYISDKKFSGKELKDEKILSKEWKSRMLDKPALSELLKPINEGATAHDLPSDTNIDAELDRKRWWYRSINLIKELLKRTKEWKWIWNEFYLRLKDQENWEQARIYSDWNIDNAWELWRGYILFQ